MGASISDSLTVFSMIGTCIVGKRYPVEADVLFTAAAARPTATNSRRLTFCIVSPVFVVVRFFSGAGGRRTTLSERRTGQRGSYVVINLTDQPVKKLVL
jgi:hypothetical protein